MWDEVESDESVVSDGEEEEDGRGPAMRMDATRTRSLRLGGQPVLS